jgi:hypothetical protein
MLTQDQLLQAVEVEFDRTSAGAQGWANPHLDRGVTQDEYSRCLDPGKWRILVARTEAWANALRRLGLARVERVKVVDWVDEHHAAQEWDVLERLTPLNAGGVPLVFAYRNWGECDDLNWVTVGAGSPVVPVVNEPGCGCDACDDGSQYPLDQLDDAILDIVTGGFRHLWRDDQQITLRGSSRFGLNPPDEPELTATLEDPSGWNEVVGDAWSGTGPG